uniref:Calmodulin-binding domain-containing protein n=1 Tax=Rhizophora mucronata TaxID=61149 RepID=A0A2P2QK50_RHIMU
MDFALRRAVNKLASARKRKVALLVEAFKTVLLIPKCERDIRHTSTAFSHARPIQACS